ncbi:MAG: hypothetical protein U0174_04335 [Polyangiaceae bacterium]
MKNSNKLAIVIRRTRSSLRTDVNTGAGADPSPTTCSRITCGPQSDSRTQTGGGGYGQSNG